MVLASQAEGCSRRLQYFYLNSEEGRTSKPEPPEASNQDQLAHRYLHYSAFF